MKDRVNRSLSRFRPFRTIFGTSLLAILHPGGIQTAAYCVIANAWQIFNAATPDQYYRVFLKVVTLSTDITRHLKTVCQAYPSHFPQGRVWFFWCRGINPGTNSPLLRAVPQRWNLALYAPRSSRFTY